MTDEWAKKAPVNVTEKLKDLKQELDYHISVIDTGCKCTEELEDMINRSLDRKEVIYKQIAELDK